MTQHVRTKVRELLKSLTDLHLQPMAPGTTLAAISELETGHCGRSNSLSTYYLIRSDRFVRFIDA